VNGYRFERICRTTHSEAYLIVEDEDVVARVDLHFANAMVYGTLIVERALDEAQIRDLRDEIDSELVQTAVMDRDDFLLAVYQGTPVRQEPFSDDDEDLDDEDDER
jgi:hypothetical protein